MALTVHNEPQGFTPSDNPVTWTFSSDMTAEDNFYYEVKVLINDVEVFETQIFPESGIYSKYDASSWASNACDVPTESQNISDDAANYAKVKLTITERYGDPVIDQDTTTTANIIVWKAKMLDEEFEDFVYTDFATVGPSINKEWLTNYPSTETQKVGLDEQVRLMALNNETDLTITVELFDENDVSIASDSFTDGAANLITIFNFSPDVIIADTSITSGDFDDAAYFIISEATPRYVDYRFNINTDCQFSTYKRLHVLSMWGTMEAYSFNLISRKSAQVKSFGYKQRWGRWDGSDFLYESKQGRDRDYAKTVDYFLVVVSDWLTEDIQNWLANNFYNSPAVFIEEEGGDLARRKIMNTAYTDNILENDTLFLEQVRLKLPSFTSMTI